VIEVLPVMSPTQLDPEALRDVVAQSSSPFERLNGAFEVCPALPDDCLLNRAPAGELADQQLDAVAGGWSALTDCGTCDICVG
jgi:hypothetical protein